MFNLRTHTHDKDTRFCPICSKKILFDEFRSNISKRYNFDTNSKLIKLRRPYIIYADTECSLVPTGLKDKTRKYIPNSACFYLVCDHDPSQNRLEYYIGENCILDMLIEMTKISDKCIEQMKKNKKMVMSAEDMMDSRHATHCSICE